MRFLTVVFASHSEFLTHFSDKYPDGALFCPTKAKVQLRSKVIVDVSMPELGQPARLRGNVISYSSGQGLWVAFDTQSSATVAYLKSAGSDETLERLSRAHSRYPASLQVSCRIDEDNPETETLTGHIVDLSRGGAFVSGSEAPLVGTRVSLDISPGTDSKSVYRVDGRVAWVGKVDSQDGFGVRFDQRGTFGAAPLRTMLRRASETGRLHLS
tara:strand:- start:114285 stop:114923 length:639 start_codon:yes stop_codon:yes gene_type:complete